MRTAQRTPPEPSHWDVVLRAWEQLDLPEGWRAEIIEGDIVLTDPYGDQEGPPPVWEVVLRAWEALDLPEGWRAGIIDHDIRVSRVPEGPPSRILARVRDRLAVWGSPTGDGATAALRPPTQRFDVRVPELGFLASPDLVVPDEEPPSGEGARGAAVRLVAEVVADNGDGRAREAAPRGYAHAAVPVYLLIDPADAEAGGAPTVTCYSRPDGGVFRQVEKAAPGGPIHLPEPFDLTLDTSGFPA